MISTFHLIVLGGVGWAGWRLWEGTTSAYARAVALSALGLLAWGLVGP